MRLSKATRNRLPVSSALGMLWEGHFSLVKPHLETVTAQCLARSPIA